MQYEEINARLKELKTYMILTWAFNLSIFSVIVILMTLRFQKAEEIILDNSNDIIKSSNLISENDNLLIELIDIKTQLLLEYTNELQKSYDFIITGKE